MAVRVAVDGTSAVLMNEHLRLDLSFRDGRLVEQISAAAGTWQPVLASAGADDELDQAPCLTAARVKKRSPSLGVLELTGRRGRHRFVVTVSLEAGARHLRYLVEDQLAGPTTLRSLESRYTFGEGAVDFCFTPHLRPGEDDVVGQFAFKSPAAIMQRGRTTVAVIADVAQIEAKGPLPLCLEADAAPRSGGPILGYGFKDHEPYGLIYFRHAKEMVRRVRGVLRYGYYVYVTPEAEPRYGYQDVVRLLWRLFGQRSAASAVPQVVPFDRYARYALDYASAHLWRELPQDGPPRGGFIMGIKFPNDIWFHFFFNHLHTAYGLYRMAQRWKDDGLLERARKIRELALSAPRRDGLIPAIYSHQIITGMRHDRWIPQAHWVGGAIPYQSQIRRPEDLNVYSTADSAWTGYWMLRWHADLEPDARLLEAARALGDHLVKIQLPSGAIPLFLHAETLAPEYLLRESPSCAAAGMFLAQLAAVTGAARYRRAAERLAGFLEAEVMPQGWTDYESFYDSAGKPMDLVDRHSRQRPQNTFPMYWTAQLCRILYQLTGEERYRRQAVRALDYLLLFQAVWSPPYLSVKGFGSIGIGNGHTGWNDARSGIFAPGVAEFYFLTGEAEYLQRGIAAMRAPLALMYIPENQRVSSMYDQGPLGYADECYAHRGRDARLGPSCFDFSVGYALVAFNELWPRLGSVFLDLKAGHGFGVDGCVVRDLSVANGKIDLRVADEVGKKRALTLRAAGVVPGQIRLAVNGKRPQAYQAAELRRGIEVEV